MANFLNRKYSHFVFAMVVVTAMLTIHASVAKSDDLDIDEVIERVFLERKKLYAGDVSVRGLKQVANFANQEMTRNTRDIVERFRFDYSQNHLFHEEELHNLSDKPTVNPLHRITILAASEGYVKSVEASTISVSDVNTPMRALDLRAVGLSIYVDLMNSMNLAAYEKMIRRSHKEEKIELERLDQDGLVVLTVIHGDPLDQLKASNRRTRCWIDTGNGYTVVRLETQSLRKGDSPDKEESWRVPTITVSTSWKPLNGTWVPLSTHTDLTVGIPDVSTSTFSFDLAFEWHSVNQDFREADYSIELLDVPRGSHCIIDGRGIRREKPVIVQHPNVDPLTLKRINTFNQ
ncbi:hypothetical protein FF011L_32730 [Roseimaritima multifibrata]|uniref:Uncharacterized protein n=1 Tax=Roseimaritima multifibrata TaxID=1930274 RepID=A0A517MHY9_9BACT|nr:hypothetical protein [Roseimaritima multifibrata]QDS94494.1 hypothetical protein FF011L_32730 [Roseimaritima multifibrata]